MEELFALQHFLKGAVQMILINRVPVWHIENSVHENR
jgi:hypothetical protein